MGVPSSPLPVKLIAGLLCPSGAGLADARSKLEVVYGPLDSKSAPVAFDFTDYYSEEMGKGIMRQYLSFRDLVGEADAAAMKIRTNRMELELAVSGRRTVNIDPGYLNMTKLVLMSTKDAPSRVYIGEGIYGQAVLRYFRGSFSPWEWTYPDYGEASAISFFNDVRSMYKDQVRSCVAEERTRNGIGCSA